MPTDPPTESDRSSQRSTDKTAERSRPPGGGRTPQAEPIEPDAPENFGRIQVWWGDGKGKTTAAMGMGFRAAGHGYRVHMLQFMKGGAPSVEPTRGEYNAIAHVPGFTYENAGQYGWHRSGSGDEVDHVAEAAAAMERTKSLIEGAHGADLKTPFSADSPAEEGVHMLILDEILYAVSRGIVEASDVNEVLDGKPDDLEIVLTGGHESPDFLGDRPDLVTNVRKVTHHFDDGTRGRKGTEY